MQKVTVFEVAGLVILIILITYQVIGKMIVVKHVALCKQKYSSGIFLKREGTLCLYNLYFSWEIVDKYSVQILIFHWSLFLLVNQA